MSANYTRVPDSDLAVAPNGKRHEENHPWGSMPFVNPDGMVQVDGRVVRQYFVDCTGAPVRTTDGHLVHLMYRENGEAEVDEHGDLIHVVVEPPDGAVPFE